jgi:hypothetical protein|tara:strand:- start:1149 stop:1454 length:306 start_codon:yes stop_codon:yes gene_type:complete
MLTAKRLAQRMQRNTPLVTQPLLLSGVAVHGSFFLFTTTTPIQISRDRNLLLADVGLWAISGPKTLALSVSDNCSVVPNSYFTLSYSPYAVWVGYMYLLNY